MGNVIDIALPWAVEFVVGILGDPANPAQEVALESEAMVGGLLPTCSGLFRRLLLSLYPGGRRPENRDGVITPVVDEPVPLEGEPGRQLLVVLGPGESNGSVTHP